MMQAIFTGASGLNAQQIRLDVVANNVANVDTTGYKAVRVDFKDALYQQLRRPVQPQDQLNLQQGTGVFVAATVRGFQNQGAPLATQNPLDVALVGNGFLAVQNYAGQVLYTRDGALSVSTEADGEYLVTGNGDYVLDVTGERIMVQGQREDIVISYDGWIAAADGQPYAQLALIEFPNQEGLLAVGNNHFMPSEASGDPALSDTLQVRQGYLESSTVDLAEEMTRLIRAQRAYQMSSRVVTTADEMEGMANQLRR